MLPPVMRQQIKVCCILSFADGTIVFELAIAIEMLIAIAKCTVTFAMLSQSFGGFTLKGLTLITDEGSAEVFISQFMSVTMEPVLLSILEQETSGAMLTLVWQGEIPSTVLGKVKE